MIAADSNEKDTNAEDNQNSDNYFKLNVRETQMIDNCILERFFD